MSDMFFDTNDFDFDSLTDIVGLHDTPSKPQPQRERNVMVDGGFVDDIADLVGDDYFSDEEEAEPDFNNDASDLIRSPTDAERTNITEYFNAADDNAVLELDGLTLSKAEIKELYKAKSKVDNDSGFFAEQAARFDADNRMINERALLKQTVLESNIDTLTKRLNNPALPDHEYAATAKQLQVAQASLFQLTQEVNQVMAKRAEQEQMVNGYRIRSADQALTSEIPQWEQIKGSVIDYALNNGVNAVQLEKSYDTGLMKLLFKSYLYDKKQATIAEQLKQKNTATNVRSTVGAKSSNRNPKAGAQDAEKAKAAISKMDGSRRNMIDAFAFLKD